MRFFNFIRLNFGLYCCSLLKECLKLFKIHQKTSVRLKFIKLCIKYDIVPPHLRHIVSHKIQFYQQSSNDYLTRLNRRYTNNLLHVELKDAYKHIYYITDKIYKVSRQLSYLLPDTIINSFFYRQEKYNFKVWLNNCKRIDEKVDWLLARQKMNIRKNINHIKYSCTKVRDPNDNYVKKSFDNLERNIETIDTHNVNISPDKFPLHVPLDKLQDKWLLNLSNSQIPEEVQFLLQLGERFNLPFNSNSKEKYLVAFIKHIEYNLRKYEENIQQSIRSQSIQIIKNLSHVNSDYTDDMILRWLASAKIFISEHPHILFTKADKGNTTVAMEITDYNTKMTMTLSDIETYEIVDKDPTRRLTNNLKDLLMRWKKKKFIADSVYRSLMLTDGILPRAYGLPKIHKNGIPLRIIVSSINSPLYALGNFLHNIIIKNIQWPNSHIKNSFELVNKLSTVILEPNFELASLDAVSLFTNVPKDLAIKSIEKRWESISEGNAIPKEEFIIGVNFILSSTYFKYNGLFYKQIFGTPMGSPLSPIIVDLVLQDIEERALNTLICPLPFYFRYVDDIVLAAPTDQLNHVLSTFNSFHNRLRFTFELGGDNINFLDTTIFIKNNSLIFDWYHKPTFSGRFLNFHSHHPLSHKRGVIFGLTDRILRISDPCFHEKNLNLAINILLENGYPLQFIFGTINNRIKKLIFNCNNSDNSSGTKNKKDFFTVPYVKHISERFSRLTKKYDLNISYSCHNSLNKFIKTGKDKIDSLCHSNVVYKLNCLDCDASYVGQTKRQLKTRVKEHRDNIKRAVSPSVISIHRSSHNHDFDWDGVEVLDEESALHKRLVSEMIQIKKQKYSLNKQSDTESLSSEYLPLIQKTYPSHLS